MIAIPRSVLEAFTVQSLAAVAMNDDEKCDERMSQRTSYPFESEQVSCGEILETAPVDVHPASESWVWPPPQAAQSTAQRATRMVSPPGARSTPLRRTGQVPGSDDRLTRSGRHRDGVRRCPSRSLPPRASAPSGASRCAPRAFPLEAR